MWTYRAAQTLQFLVVATLTTAGVAKLVDLAAFAQALQGWTIIPVTLRWIAILVVPVLEALALPVWLVSRRRNTTTGVALLAILTFSLLLVVQTAVSEAPDCGCFGKLVPYKQGIDSVQLVLTRNSVLCMFAVAGILLSRRPPSCIVHS